MDSGGKRGCLRSAAVVTITQKPFVRKGQGRSFFSALLTGGGKCFIMQILTKAHVGKRRTFFDEIY